MCLFRGLSSYLHFLLVQLLLLAARKSCKLLLPRFAITGSISLYVKPHSLDRGGHSCSLLLLLPLPKSLLLLLLSRGACRQLLLKLLALLLM